MSSEANPYRLVVRRFWLVFVAIQCIACPVLFAEEGSSAKSLRQAVENGEWALSLRPRIEWVDDQRFSDNAEAFTLRTSATFKTAPLSGFTLGFEVEDITVIGSERYNNAGAGSRGNGVTDRPVVADPDLTEMNQAWLAYDFDGATSLKAGRFELNLGDQRFVGAVGWRQNHQSFDGAVLQSKFGETQGPWSFHYAYLDQVHTVTAARQELVGHLLDLRHAFSVGTAGLTAVLLDYSEIAARSTQTWAGHFTGKQTVGDGVTWHYDLQLAEQSDSADNPQDFSHQWYRVDTAIALQGFTLRVGTEVMEGDGSTAFQFPLGTNHKFSGWADRFLATPADGLEDRYLKVAHKRGEWSFLLAYHDFRAQRLSRDYGSEIDFQVLWSAPWKQQFGLKFADYNRDTFSVDGQKIMLFSTLVFR